MSSGFMGSPSRISRFDMYRSVPKDLAEPTSIGGTVSLLAMVVMGYLFLTELYSYLTPTITSTLSVGSENDLHDKTDWASAATATASASASAGTEGEQGDAAAVAEVDMVRLNFDVTMLRLPCVVASVDHQDVMGGHTMDIHGSVTKTRVSATGAIIGPYVPHEEREDHGDHEHGDGRDSEEAPAAPARDNAQSDKAGKTTATTTEGETAARVVIKKRTPHMHGHSHGHGAITPALAAQLAAEADEQIGEGCRITGFISVKKVPGNFHISAHAHANLLPRLFPAATGAFMDVSHRIHALWFGSTAAGAAVRSHVAAARLDPLAGSTARLPQVGPRAAPYSQEYFLEVVPTTFTERGGRVHRVHQFVAHRTAVQGRYAIPAVYFRLNFSPIAVAFTAEGKPLAQFVVQVCAIVGGVFTVLGLVSGWLNSSYRVLVNKRPM